MALAERSWFVSSSAQKSDDAKLTVRVQVFTDLVCHAIINEVFGLMVVPEQPRSSPQDAVSMQKLNLSFLDFVVATLVVVVPGVDTQHREQSEEHGSGIFQRCNEVRQESPECPDGGLDGETYRAPQRPVEALVVSKHLLGLFILWAYAVTQPLEPGLSPLGYRDRIGFLEFWE